MEWYKWLPVWALTAGGFLIGILVVLICIVGLVFLLNGGRNLNPQPATNPGVTGPAPASQGPRFDWSLGFPSSRFWKLVWTLLLVVATAAIAWYVYTHFSVPTITTPAMPTITLPTWRVPDFDFIAIGLAIAALVAVGAGLWFFADKKRLGTYVYVTTVVLLVYWLYRYGMLNIPRTYLLYVLAGVGAVMVFSYVTGFGRFSLGILLAAAFLMLGYSHHHTWDQFTDILASVTSSGSSTSSRVAVRNPCDQVVRHVRVDIAGSVVNPGGACTYAFEVTSGQLFFHGPEGSSEVWWPGKRAVGNVRKRVVTAYAVTPNAELDYLLCPAGMDGTGWYCH